MHTNKRFWFLLTLASVSLASCSVFRYSWYNLANVTDYRIFPQRKLLPSATPFRFKDGTEAHLMLDSASNKKGVSRPLGVLLQETYSLAFMVIRNDSVLYEWYNPKNAERTTPALSFSVAKSITSILIGCAIDDKLIGSVTDPVIKYIPELKENKGFDKLTIQHVLEMRSGINFNENYSNPFSDVTKMYYAKGFERLYKHLKVVKTPGTEFKYLNGNTQLLGIILTNVLKQRKQTLSDYFAEKIWTPIGMEYEGGWNIYEKEPYEKTFCCFHATATDYAKIGRLYLNRGNWNGTQLVSQSWVDQSTYFTGKNNYGKTYRYQWWQLNPDEFYADGHLGQFIFVNKKKNLIMVRLGTSRKNYYWPTFFHEIAAKL